MLGSFNKNIKIFKILVGIIILCLGIFLTKIVYVDNLFGIKNNKISKDSVVVLDNVIFLINGNNGITSDGKLKLLKNILTIE